MSCLPSKEFLLLLGTGLDLTFPGDSSYLLFSGCVFMLDHFKVLLFVLKRDLFCLSNRRFDIRILTVESKIVFTSPEFIDVTGLSSNKAWILKYMGRFDSEVTFLYHISC